MRPYLSVGSTVIVWSCLAVSGAAQAPAPSVPTPAAQEIATSLFLIGDAGHADRPDHPVVSAVREAASSNPARSLILYLGDNAYPQGLPEKDAPGRAAAEVRLNTQVDAARASGAATIFISGNHDWAKARERRMGPGATRGRATWSSAGGQPSASFRKMAARARSRWTSARSVRLVLLDTQWWLHKHAKPVDPTSTCSDRFRRRGARGAARCDARGSRPARLRGGPSPAGERRAARGPLPPGRSPLPAARVQEVAVVAVAGHRLGLSAGAPERDQPAGPVERGLPAHARLARVGVSRHPAPRLSGRPRPRLAGALRGRRPPRARQRLGELRPQQRRQEARQHALRRGQAGLHAGGCSRGRARPPRRALVDAGGRAAEAFAMWLD